MGITAQLFLGFLLGIIVMFFGLLKKHKILLIIGIVLILLTLLGFVGLVFLIGQM
jgi:hypothetical protein